MNEPIAADISGSKGGEEIVRIRAQRTLKEGLQINLWAHPLIEDFFRNLSGGDQVNVREFGQEWRSKKPLVAYTIPFANQIQFQQNRSVSFDHLGYPLVVINPDGRQLRQGEMAPEQINLAPLRLVGLSEGPGVTFSLNFVASDNGVLEMCQKFAEQVKWFYRLYLRPVDYHLSIVATRIE